MAVEKPMNPAQMDIEDADAVQVEVVNPEAVSVTTEDESMVIDFTGEMTEDLVGPNHDANLAEYIEEADLQALASELVEDFMADRQSRKDWARSYVKGLDLLGMKIEERTSHGQVPLVYFTPFLQKLLSAFRHRLWERFSLRLALSVQNCWKA